MVHLSPDSRLLASLVKQEQAYASQLYNLLEASGTSLSALVIYASSSPPTISPTLKGVASALSGADDAYRNYGEALNDWVDQLRMINRKEEEVANIGRDREILVTRLIKVTQKTKATPQSLLHPTPDSSSNVSFPSFNSKVTAVQLELQACESHLAEKERALESFRSQGIRQGLKLRCQALIQCGWVWGEMGRRAISMLEDTNGVAFHQNGNGAPSEFYKPLPNGTRDLDRDSALSSSISPSQSASQIGVFVDAPSLPKNSYSLNIPPPHLVSESTAIPGPSRAEEEASSSEYEGPTEVHENPRFQPANLLNNRLKTTTQASPRSSPVHFAHPSTYRTSSSDIGSSKPAGRTRDRRGTGIFGNIASLFKTSMVNNSNKAGSSSHTSSWSTRTDRNLRGSKTDIDSSDEDDRPRSGRLRKFKAQPSIMPESSRGMVGAGAAPLSMPSPQSRLKHSAAGSVSRSSTIKSSISEPPSAPRGRASSLTMTSNTVMQTLSPPPESQIRRASMDGKYGSRLPSGTLDSVKSAPRKRSSKRVGVPNGDSLMSIVEGNYDDHTAKMELVRAPGNMPVSVPILVNHPPPLPSDESASTVNAKRASLSPVGRSTRSLTHADPEKKPLRSAMRSPHRDSSSSPIPPSPVSSTAADAGQSNKSAGAPSPPLERMKRPMSMSRTGVPSTIIESPRQSLISPGVHPTGQTVMTTEIAEVQMIEHPSPRVEKDDDTMSISSYETGHESFEDGDDDARTPPAHSEVGEPLTTPSSRSKKNGKAIPSHQTPLPNPNANVPNGGTMEVHEGSSVTSGETATRGASVRRKSVRMSSLPPQVLERTPTQEAFDANGPFMDPSTPSTQQKGWKTRVAAVAAVWEDSSDEDEEYRAARHALSRAERRSSVIMR